MVHSSTVLRSSQVVGVLAENIVRTVALGYVGRAEMFFQVADGLGLDLSDFKVPTKYGLYSFDLIKWADNKVRDNRRRASRKYGLDRHISGLQWLDVCSRNSWACVFCGSYEGKALTMEHIVSMSDGGSNSVENITCSCSQCNNARDRAARVGVV